MISFVIPAHNEEALIGATLDSIQQSATEVGEPFEVIVVDDASTDRTAEIARDRGATVVPVNHRQIAATRNSGAAVARGEWLIFVDGDTVINTPLLQATVDALSGGAIGGGCRIAFEGDAPWSWRAAVKLFGPMYHWMQLAAGCYLFVQRGAFEEVGGFDSRLYASEEVVLSRSLRQLGRFVILRERVTTSGRKLRTHKLREGLAILARLALRGRGVFHKREGLDVWYGPRRE